jgi:hypothetical protein
MPQQREFWIVGFCHDQEVGVLSLFEDEAEAEAAAVADFNDRYDHLALGTLTEFGEINIAAGAEEIDCDYEVIELWQR